MMALATALGPEFDRLPEPLRRFHGGAEGRVYLGRVTVEGGGALARLLCRIGGLPRPGYDMPFRMRIYEDAAGWEVWDRDFDGHSMISRLRPDGPAHVREYLGPLRVQMRPTRTEAGLEMPITGLRFLCIPLPLALLRDGGGRETVLPDGRIAFSVSGHGAGIGLLIRYTGTLAPEEV